MQVLTVGLAFFATSVMADQPTALVYRGPAACEGCAESVGNVLETSASNFKVIYVGPNEDLKLTKDALSNADVYAQPGGGGLDDSWPDVEEYKNIIRDYVSNGGRYLGFCLGAYFAGSNPGFELLPQGDDVDQEITQKGAQVKNENDTVIQVDWTFSSGSLAGSTRKNKWLYFQDGAVINMPNTTPGAKVIARYSKNGDIAASLSSFGDGWVGLVGPHPEATQDWYDDENISNPDGVNLDYAYDFIETTYNA